nr:MAG TPA: hypothetical protein [Caudoviricetes sp.]
MNSGDDPVSRVCFHVSLKRVYDEFLICLERFDNRRLFSEFSHSNTSYFKT